MLSASSGVRISSKSEKSEIDKSSIVTFESRDIVDELRAKVAAVIDVFSNALERKRCRDGFPMRCAG